MLAFLIGPRHRPELGTRNGTENVLTSLVSPSYSVEPVTPPTLYAEEELSVDPDDILIHPSPSPSTTLWDSYLHRHNAESGRSLSDSTHLTTSSSNTASTLPSDILATPPQQGNMPLFAVNMDQPYPASTAMGRNFSSPGSVTPKPIRPGHAGNDSSTPTSQDYRSDHHHHHFHPHHHHGADTKVLLSNRGDSTAKIVSKEGDPNHYELDVEIGGHSVIFDPDRPEQIGYRGPKLPHYSQSSFSSPSAMRSHELPTKVLLADRGDNTARLVPTPDGSYVLDVSIGGKKLLVNPERPAEIQYHNKQGEVVTQSLIHAQ